MQEPTLTSRILRVRSLRQLLAFSLLAAVAVSAAFLLTPSRFTPAIPEDNALGTPFTGTLKANRDYDVLDTETTAQKREEAARSVWPVYDFDGGAAEAAQRHIGDAFAEARVELAAWEKAHPGKARRGDEREFLLSRRDEFWKTLQAVVDDDDYLELGYGGFDSTLESAATRLAGLASAGFIVGERGLLAADRERGIVVRSISGPAREQTVRDIDRIQDLAQARAAVERLAAVQLPELAPPQRRALVQLVRRVLRANLAYDDLETRRREEQKREQVKDVVLQLKKGEKIIGDGEQITKAHLLIFHAIRAAGRESDAAQVRFGGGLFAALVCAVLFEFGRRNLRKFRLRSRDVVLLATLVVGQLCLVRCALFAADALHDWASSAAPPPLGPALAQALPWLAPLALGSLLVRFLLHAEAALLWTAAFAPLSGLLAGGSMQVVVAAFVGGIVAADRIGHAGSRAAVFRAGLFTGAATAVVAGAFAMFQGHLFSWDTLAQLACSIVGGAVLLPILALVFAPLFEAMFGYVTNVRLLELANFNHPVLKDLIVQAPGTYHHAILIGQLVEEAAREIGANPLLARVGAYYHDIGKRKNPLLFGENQKGENRHESLTPQMSAQLIRRHVADGIQLAREVKLPRQVIDFIPQHHGTRLIGYFFHKAKEEAARAGLPPPAEADYRYEGPRPQTREAALVMLGDVVVATTRNLSQPTRESLRALVEGAVQALSTEGELVECEITLRDLDLTVASFVRSLERIMALVPGAPGPGDATAPQLRVLDGARATLRRA